MGLGMRRTLVISLIGFLILTACSGGEQTDSSEGVDTIRVASFPGAGALVGVFIAADLGLFEKNQLEVEFVETTLLMEPLFGGDVDVSATASPIVVGTALSNGANLKVLSTICSNVLHGLVVRPDVAEQLTAQPGEFPGVITALKGKKIGAQRGSAQEFNLRYLFQLAGLDPDRDFRVVPTSDQASQAAALQSKQVDAIMTSTPLPITMSLDGSGETYLDLASQGPPAIHFPFVVAAATEQWVEDHSRAASRFVAAMEETYDYIRNPSNRDEVRELMAKHLELEPMVLDALADQVIACAQPSFTTEDIDKLNEYLVSLDLIEEPIDPSTFRAEGITSE